MTHLSKDIPYRYTTISYDKSMTDISELLREAGAHGIRWTEMGTELPVVEFLIYTELKGRKYEFRVMVKPPMMPDKKMMNQKTVITYNRNASMRLTYWYLKSKLEAIKFGLEDIFSALLLRVVHTLPNGEEKTIGESIKEDPESIKLVLPTFDVKVKELPNKENSQDVLSSS